MGLPQSRPLSGQRGSGAARERATSIYPMLLTKALGIDSKQTRQIQPLVWQFSDAQAMRQGQARIVVTTVLALRSTQASSKSFRMPLGPERSCSRSHQKARTQLKRDSARARGRAASLMRLSCLSPEIVRDILAGHVGRFGCQTAHRSFQRPATELAGSARIPRPRSLVRRANRLERSDRPPQIARREKPASAAGYEPRFRLCSCARVFEREKAPKAGHYQPARLRSPLPGNTIRKVAV